MLTKVSRFPDLLLINDLDKITSVTVTSDDKFIISASGDESIKMFDLYARQQDFGNLE